MLKRCEHCQRPVEKLIQELLRTHEGEVCIVNICKSCKDLYEAHCQTELSRVLREERAS